MFPFLSAVPKCTYTLSNFEINMVSIWSNLRTFRARDMLKNRFKNVMSRIKYRLLLMNKVKV